MRHFTQSLFILIVAMIMLSLLVAFIEQHAVTLMLLGGGLGVGIIVVLIVRYFLGGFSNRRKY